MGTGVAAALGIGYLLKKYRNWRARNKELGVRRQRRPQRGYRIRESYGVGMGTDWATGVTDQEYQFQRWLADVRKRSRKGRLKEEALPKKKVHVAYLPDARHPPKGSRGTKETLRHYRDLLKQSTMPSGVLHHYRTLERESRNLKEDEDKWKRMKGHIAASARVKGIGGKRFNAYVYGAMRDRGWKPRRERVDETMDSLHQGYKRVKKDFDKEVLKPIRSLKRAERYRRGAYQHIAAGNWNRGLEMLNRVQKVRSTRTPPLVAGALGWAAGPGFGSGEVMGYLAAKGTRKAMQLNRRLRPGV
jgi:hypothetical protein